MNEDITYILERKDASIRRRFYVGRTNDLNRRLQEHSKDRYAKYALVWSMYGNYEAKIKSFGAVIFMECIRESQLFRGGHDA